MMRFKSAAELRRPESAGYDPLNLKPLRERLQDVAKSEANRIAREFREEEKEDSRGQAKKKAG